LNKTGQKSAGFELFAFTWAMACLFHQFSFADWRWYDKGILLTAAVLSVLYKPSWQRFAVLIIVDWLSVAWEFPLHPNHIVFSWVVNATLITSLLIVAYKNKGISDPDMASNWYAVFAPWLRVELCILYFFTVFHKLNVVYFEVDLSCAAKLHLEINDRFPLMPEGKWALYSAIYGTLIIEAAIPLLLLFRRTFFAGAVLGVLFHALLALHSHMGLFSFSSTMMALFTVFLPLHYARALKPSESICKIWRLGLLGAGALLLVWISRGLFPWGPFLEEKLHHNWKLGFLGYYVYVVVALILFIRAKRVGMGDSEQIAVGNWRAQPALIAFSLLLIINGFGPYFGLKTQTSFSMFSNLQTENGTTNHLIMPSGIQVTSWQYDFVEIVGSNEPNLIGANENDLFVVYLELRRIRTSARSDFWVTFRRNGKNETFDMKKPETHNVLPALGPLAKRYFFFRHFERDPMNVRCQQ